MDSSGRGQRTFTLPSSSEISDIRISRISLSSFSFSFFSSSSTPFPSIISTPIFNPKSKAVKKAPSSGVLTSEAIGKGEGKGRYNSELLAVVSLRDADSRTVRWTGQE
jgi:hypothetical protein